MRMSNNLEARLKDKRSESLSLIISGGISFRSTLQDCPKERISTLNTRLDWSEGEGVLVGYQSEQRLLLINSYKPMSHTKRVPISEDPFSPWGFNTLSSDKKKSRHDRFVPDLVGTKLYNIFKEDKLPPNPNPSHDKYTSLLQEELLRNEPKKILRFGNDSTKENLFSENNMAFRKEESAAKKTRKVSRVPYKELDAPLLRDDFYLNLIDWSPSNCIAAGLNTSVMLWSGCSSNIQKVYKSPDYEDYICSVAFPKSGSLVAFGKAEGKVLVYDLNKKKEVNSFSEVHESRVGSLACTSNLICSGAKNGVVSVNDLRQKELVACWQAHEQEICGIKWSHDGQMIASGGNDNKMALFSLRTMSQIAEFSQHKAAVKALAFDPNSPIVATGGGSADKHIRFFSTQSLTEVYSLDTGSQICNIHFSPVSRELVTTHGFSLNQINLWSIKKNNEVEKTATLTGHSCRVLYLAGEQHGSRIVTGAGDQSLKFWNVFESSKQNEQFDLR